MTLTFRLSHWEASLENLSAVLPLQLQKDKREYWINENSKNPSDLGDQTSRSASKFISSSLRGDYGEF